MKEKTTGWANRALLAMVTLLITYFSIVSTFTNSRVSDIECRTEKCDERVVVTERNIAVILEKIRNIESILVMMREEMLNRQRTD